MTETPAEAFRRVRKEHGDTWKMLGRKVGISWQGVLSSVKTRGLVPRCWLTKLPEPYRSAVVRAMINQRVQEITELSKLIPDYRITISGAKFLSRDNMQEKP